MALACNLHKADRTLRVMVGALLGLGAVLVRANIVAAIFMGFAGLVILVEGVIGH